MHYAAGRQTKAKLAISLEWEDPWTSNLVYRWRMLPTCGDLQSKSSQVALQITTCRGWGRIVAAPLQLHSLLFPTSCLHEYCAPELWINIFGEWWVNKNWQHCQLLAWLAAYQHRVPAPALDSRPALKSRWISENWKGPWIVLENEWKALKKLEYVCRESFDKTCWLCELIVIVAVKLVEELLRPFY